MCELEGGCLYHGGAMACPLCDEHGADDIARYEQSRAVPDQPADPRALARLRERRRAFMYGAVIGFACFADPSAQGIWVVASQVVTVLHNAGDCAKGSNTKIVTVSGTLCVRETPAQVVKLLNEAGK